MSHSHTKQLKQLIAQLQDLIDGDGRDLTFNSCTMKGHMLPAIHASGYPPYPGYDIGSAEYKIRHIFCSDNSIWIGDSHKIETTTGKMKFRKRRADQIPVGMQQRMDDFLLELEPSDVVTAGGQSISASAYQAMPDEGRASDRATIVQSAADDAGINIAVLSAVRTAQWVAIAHRMGEQQLNHAIADKAFVDGVVDPNSPGSTLRFLDMFDDVSGLFDLDEDFEVEVAGDGTPSPQVDGQAGIFTVSNSFSHQNSTNGTEDIEVYSYPSADYVGGRMTLHISDNANNSQIRELLFISAGPPVDMASINAQGTRTLGDQLMSGQTAEVDSGTVRIKVQTQSGLNGTQFFGKIIVELIAK